MIKEHRRRKNIFIVSEKLELRLILSKEFSQYGYQIFEFATVAQVLPFLKIQKPDIILIHHLYLKAEIHLMITEILEETKENCYVIFLIDESKSKNDFQTRIDILRIGGNQVIYINEETLKLPTNQILNEIDHYFDLIDTNKNHLLYIKNNEDYNDIYINILKESYYNVDVFSYKEIFELIHQKNFYMLQELYAGIILNLYYPDFLGIELVRIIRQFHELKHLPVIFITKDSEIHRFIYTIQKGGDAYIVHPTPPEVFITIINSHYYRYKIFKNNLDKDLMTNLYNHHSFLRKLEIKMKIFEKANQSFAYALIDIDKFKSINDKYSHQAGDQVIINLARFLKHNLRDYDIIGRYGGEEFGVILNTQDKLDAFKIMDRIRSNFSIVNHRYESSIFTCTISIGIAMFPEFNTTTSLISAADYGLYQSKEQGRNKVIIIESKDLKKDSH